MSTSLGMQPDRAARRAQQTQERAAKALLRMSAMATTVLLVRHGETDWNLEHRLQGQMQPGPPLNAVGFRQATAVAQRLQIEKLSALYTSDLGRAMQTASEIATATGLQAVTTPELRERNLGDLTGLTYKEAEEKMPKAYALLRTSRQDVVLPGGGESLNGLQLRVHAAVTALAARHPGQTIALVVHGGFLAAVYRQATGESCPARNSNCALNAVKVDNDGAWALLTWGDVSYLQAAGFSASSFGGGEAG